MFGKHKMSKSHLRDELEVKKLLLYALGRMYPKINGKRFKKEMEYVQSHRDEFTYLD